MNRAWLALAGLVLGLVGGTGVAFASELEPEPDTIVRVEGDAANGFGIHYYDGTSIYPPTDSEALAECGEYHRRWKRVRCRTQVRVWYRDLADLQQSLAWALSE